MTLPDHEDRLNAARAVARWYLGDGSWADKLAAAYCNPDEARDEVRRERGDQ